MPVNVLQALGVVVSRFTGPGVATILLCHLASCHLEPQWMFCYTADGELAMSIHTPVSDHAKQAVVKGLNLMPDKEHWSRRAIVKLHVHFFLFPLLLSYPLQDDSCSVRC